MVRSSCFTKSEFYCNIFDFTYLKEVRKNLMNMLKTKIHFFVSQMFHQGDILEIGRIARISSGN